MRDKFIIITIIIMLKQTMGVCGTPPTFSHTSSSRDTLAFGQINFYE
jgi:hypothetical protein